MHTIWLIDSGKQWQSIDLTPTMKLWHNVNLRQFATKCYRCAPMQISKCKFDFPLFTWTRCSKAKMTFHGIIIQGVQVNGIRDEMTEARFEFSQVSWLHKNKKKLRSFSPCRTLTIVYETERKLIKSSAKKNIFPIFLVQKKIKPAWRLYIWKSDVPVWQPEHLQRYKVLSFATLPACDIDANCWLQTIYLCSECPIPRLDMFWSILDFFLQKVSSVLSDPNPWQ